MQYYENCAIVVDLMMNNKGLKKLELVMVQNIFDEDISSKIDFKLNEFRLLIYDDQKNNKRDQNINRFLQTQRNSLETLAVKGFVLRRYMMRTILSMPRLKTLNLGFAFQCSVSLANKIRKYPPNFSINNLQCTIRDATFWKLFPNVRNLILYGLYDRGRKNY